MQSPPMMVLGSWGPSHDLPENWLIGSERAWIGFDTSHHRPEHRMKNNGRFLYHPDESLFQRYLYSVWVGAETYRIARIIRHD